MWKTNQSFYLQIIFCSYFFSYQGMNMKFNWNLGIYVLWNLNNGVFSPLFPGVKDSLHIQGHMILFMLMVYLACMRTRKPHYLLSPACWLKSHIKNLYTWNQFINAQCCNFGPVRRTAKLHKINYNLKLFLRLETH